MKRNDKRDRFITLTIVVALIVVIGLICAVALAGAMNAGAEAILMAGLGWAG